MQHVAAREDARHAGLEAFVDNGAVRHTGERCARAEGEFVFRDQTDGQKQRIARIILFRARIEGFNLSSTALMVTPVTRSLP